jgi:hypothetical protein
MMLPKAGLKPGFGSANLSAESRFFRVPESAFGRLEKSLKNPIFSVAC